MDLSLPIFEINISRHLLALAVSLLLLLLHPPPMSLLLRPLQDTDEPRRPTQQGRSTATAPSTSSAPYFLSTKRTTTITAKLNTITPYSSSSFLLFFLFLLFFFFLFFLFFLLHQ